MWCLNHGAKRRYKTLLFSIINMKLSIATTGLGYPLKLIKDVGGIRLGVIWILKKCAEFTYPARI